MGRQPVEYVRRHGIASYHSCKQDDDGDRNGLEKYYEKSIHAGFEPGLNH